ncbi:MAG: PEP-CTERM sorting domain-containing protein [Pseudomonadota bacterium]
MKILAAVVACCLAMAVPRAASAIDVLTNGGANVAGVPVRQPELATAPVRAILPTSQLSELPEPEVFAMMLLGLVLIGYRSSRNSEEKFK